jgi:uncharacterized protein (AIM24 family)
VTETIGTRSPASGYSANVSDATSAPTAFNIDTAVGGNVFAKRLEPGEQIDVEPGGWLYKEPAVQMATNLQNLSTGFFGSMNFVTNRFTGPGRLGIQSLYLHMPSEE